MSVWGGVNMVRSAVYIITAKDVLIMVMVLL